MKYLYVAAAPEVNLLDHREVRRRLTLETGSAWREMAIPSVDFSYDADRGQFASIPVLQMLLGHCPGDAEKMLAITARDLFVPALTFVYGQAQLSGRVAVFSLARLRQEFYGLPPDREVFWERAAKEALHETGHLFGLVHCSSQSCAMSLATNIRQIDGKRAAFCVACRARFARTKGDWHEEPLADSGSR